MKEEIYRIRVHCKNMAQTIQNLHHEFIPVVEIKAINPVYENRMYISGFLGFIGTTYKKEMVSSDGYEDVWTCQTCGQPYEDKFHKPKIIRTDMSNLKS